jgi:hypothetical protein
MTIHAPVLYMQMKVDPRFGRSLEIDDIWPR